MYKWPQGRVIRTVCFIIISLVVGDLAYTGAYAQFTAASSSEHATRQLVSGGFFILLAVTALVGGLLSVGFIKSTVDFLIEVERELLHVEWPKPDQIWKSTAVIGVVIVALALVLALVDWTYAAAINFGIPRLAAALAN
jgi:preprotein translocase SecE subunit